MFWVNIKQNNICMLMRFENCQALKQATDHHCVFKYPSTQFKKKIELECHGNVNEAENAECWI